MGKKKIIDPATIIAIDDTPEVAVPPAPVGEKKKREVSEKQRENLKKGMAALKAKREQNRATQEAEATEVAPATPTPIPSPEVKTLPVVKERKPRADKGQARVIRPPPVSRDDFDNFRKELLTSLTPQERIVEKPIDRIVEKYTERVVEKPTTKFVSGSDLLDSIFFRK
jgi:type IV secretory pathway ATPase VirB11/archaellum biosynthesis ATPase